MSSVLVTPITQSNAAKLREEIEAEKLATDKRTLAAMSRELRLQEERDTERRLIDKLTKEGKVSLASAGLANTKTRTYTAEDSTRRTLLNIVSAVILSVVTLMFLHYYASNPTFVMICCFLYIVLYCAFVIYVVNKVEDSFPDKTLSIVAKWSSILSLVLCVLLAISTTKNALFSPKKPEANKLLDSSGNQLYPPGGQNQMRKKNKGFNNQGNNQRFNNGPNNQGYNQGPNNQGQNNQGYNNGN
jgi:hypothetical protein